MTLQRNGRDKTIHLLCFFSITLWSSKKTCGWPAIFLSYSCSAIQYHRPRPLCSACKQQHRKKPPCCIFQAFHSCESMEINSSLLHIRGNLEIPLYKSHLVCNLLFVFLLSQHKPQNSKQYRKSRKLSKNCKFSAQVSQQAQEVLRNSTAVTHEPALRNHYKCKSSFHSQITIYKRRAPGINQTDTASKPGIQCAVCFVKLDVNV